MNKSKKLLSFLFLLISSTVLLNSTTVMGQIKATKMIDEGGSGPFKAYAVSETSLPDYVVYRPQDLSAAVQKLGKLPAFIWANGACANSSIHHERMLNEIASHGFVIVAVGPLQMTEEERSYARTADTVMLPALDWIQSQAQLKGSAYFEQVDLRKIAVGGQSCGGAQTFRIAADPRIQTYLIFNSGMGPLQMAGASSLNLPLLHKPVIYILGGVEEVAYKNALTDYELIHHVPVVFANHLTAGHGGTFGEPYGGSYSQMALDWLNWVFRGVDQTSLFVHLRLWKYPGWTIKSKGF